MNKVGKRTVKINNIVIKNILSLLVLQGTIYLLPLVTFPYLVKTLGVEYYGLSSISLAVANYLAVLVDFGFNFSATREVALNKDNKEKLNIIITRVYLLKFLLLIFGFILLILLVLFIPSMKNNMEVYLGSFIYVIGTSLFPIWYYQGIEKMGYTTFLNIFGRVVSTIAIFIFIKEQDDYILSILIQSLGTLVSGIVGFLLIFTKFTHKVVVKLSISEILEDFKNSLNIFISTLAGNVYGNGAVIITGLVAGNEYAGFYSIIQKVSGAIVGLSQPFSQALYPYLCRLYEDNIEKYIKMKRSISNTTLLIAMFISIATFLFSKEILYFVSNEVSNYLIIMMEVSSITIFLTIFNVMLNPLILSMQKYKSMRKIYINASIVFLVISILFTTLFKGIGMVITMVVVEGFVFIGSILITRRINNERKSLSNN